MTRCHCDTPPLEKHWRNMKSSLCLAREEVKEKDVKMEEKVEEEEWKKSWQMKEEEQEEM